MFQAKKRVSPFPNRNLALLAPPSTSFQNCENRARVAEVYNFYTIFAVDLRTHPLNHIISLVIASYYNEDSILITNEDKVYIITTELNACRPPDSCFLFRQQ